jgi:hypothetical protein
VGRPFYFQAVSFAAMHESLVAFAVANQLGNAGYSLSAVILIIAAICYAVIIVRAEKPDRR